MSVVEFLPPEVKEYFGRFDQDLYGHIHDFARNNNAYRNGVVDRIDLHFAGVQVPPKLSDDLDFHFSGVRADGRVINQGNFDEVSFDFEASRVRDTEKAEGGRVLFTAYSFGLIAVKNNIQIPVTTFESEWAVQPLKSQELVTDGNMTRRVLFSINNDTKNLKLCDSVTYYDEEAVELSSLCNCDEIGSESPVHLAPYQTDRDDEHEEDDEDTGGLFTADEIDSGIETIIEELTDQNKLATALAMEDDFGFGTLDVLTRERELAYTVFSAMVRAIRSQFRP